MMRRLLRASSSRGSKEKENEEKEKPKYNLPRATDICPCVWPCDAFLQAAGIYDDFYYLVGNAGITGFLLDQCDQYLLLTNTSVQNFHFHARKSPPMVDFYLYDEYKEMTLYDFCVVCKLPYEGSVEEPRPSDVEGFIAEITVGETRGVSGARVASIHFPVLRYYSLFVGRCLIGRGESGGLSGPDLAILCHALHRDRTYSLGAMVAKRLSMNHTNGPIFGGIFASRLAKHFEIPIRHYEKEEKLLPTIYLDYDNMVAHKFISHDEEKRLIYNLVFSENTFQIITLPAPILSDFHSGRYFVLPSDIHAY